VTKSGKTILCEWYNAPLIGTDGEVLGVLSLVEDVTKLRSVEEQLRQSQKMEAIGRLAGGVAHDFNNMLNVILGYTELILARSGLNQGLAEEIREIDKAARRSADLTRQLLAFSRKQIISPRSLELNPAVEGMQATLSRLIGEDIELVFKPGSDLWRIKIDPSQLDHILANLAANARDAMPKGGRLQIETKNVVVPPEEVAHDPDVASGEFVQLTVSDTGRGIDPATRAHIFEPFFTTKDEATSTGLGLATVQSIVAQYGGFIRFRSDVGKGTTFVLHFPSCSERPAPISGAHLVHLEPATESVLLVEDDPMVRDLVTTVLKDIGYTVFVADSAKTAQQIFKDHRDEIDLLITDVVMPNMSGKELQDSLLKTKPDLKTLFMSGYTADTISRQGILDQGVHFIPKPFGIAMLARKVREVLEDDGN
jgi:signal transduction histidine kinase/ActR/RegA family two-component response regulator